MNAASIRPFSCTHTTGEHLFHSVFCSHQPLLEKTQKIAVVCFIAIAVVWGTSILRKRYLSVDTSIAVWNKSAKHQVKESRALDANIPQEWKNSCSFLGQKAIDSSLSELQKPPFNSITPRQFTKDEVVPVNQPQKPIINYLNTLYEFHLNQLEPLLAQNQPWENPKAIEHAKACMHLGFTISVFTLEEVRIVPKEEGKYRTPLEDQANYYFIGFFRCVYMYSLVKKYLYKSHEQQKLFYQEGTIQNEWRELHNEFCKKFSSLQHLASSDERFKNWTKAQDLGNGQFKPFPDTMPTYTNSLRYTR